MQIVGTKTAIRQELQQFGLTERQSSFINAYLDGLDFQAAALASGYSVVTAKALLRSAKVQQAMALILDRFLIGELAPAALHTISLLLNDSRTAAGIKANLALGVLDRSGFSAKRFDKQGELGKDASAMTSAELQAEIDKLSREIEGRMVDVTPDSEPPTSQELDTYA